MMAVRDVDKLLEDLESSYLDDELAMSLLAVIRGDYEPICCNGGLD